MALPIMNGRRFWDGLELRLVRHFDGVAIADLTGTIVRQLLKENEVRLIHFPLKSPPA